MNVIKWIWSQYKNRDVREKVVPQEPNKLILVEIPSQIPNGIKKDFGIYKTYQVDTAMYHLYKHFREIPVFDAAVNFFVEMVGTCRVVSKNKTLEKGLNDFYQNVKVNYVLHGMNEFILQFVDSMLQYGNAWGEMIPYENAAGIAHLRNAETFNMRIVWNPDTKNYEMGYLKNDGFNAIPIERQDLIFYAGRKHREGNPIGYSLFSAIPFVSQTLEMIHTNIYNSCWRFGDPSLIASYEGDSTASILAGDQTKASNDLKAEFEKIARQRKQGNPTDLFTVPPPGFRLVVKSLGTDAPIMNLTIPTKTIYHEISAGLEIPLFLLGITLDQASSYKLTTHQTEIILRRIEALRNKVAPDIKRVLTMQALMMRYPRINYELEWDAPSLMEKTEVAQVRLNNASAEKIIVETMLLLKDGGIGKAENILQYISEHNLLEGIKLEIGEVKQIVNTVIQG